MKIYFKGKCNNDCIFCDVDKRKDTLFSQAEKKIEKAFKKKDKRIVFTGAEPTFREDILDLLSLAKKKKIDVIQLNTNGRLLSDKKFAEKIIKAGANYFKVSLHGDTPKLHDYFSQKEGSFNQTIRGIKNLINLGQRDNIVLSIVINRLNYEKVASILKIAQRFKIKKIQINAVKTDNDNLLMPLEILGHQLSGIRYRFFFDLLIKSKGVPYCLIREPESFFLEDRRNKGYQHLKECKSCRHNKICPGIWKSYSKISNVSKIKPFLDLPVEVMIEIESRCNFKCKFCFNRISFASKGHGGQTLRTGEIKKIIDNIKKAGIPQVRFTGGEPLLREDLLELIKYAYSKGLIVRLNTNGYLIKSYAQVKEMVKYLDYVLFSLHTYDVHEDEKITGVEYSLDRKLRAIKWFRKAGIRIIRINTIATLKNIRNLEKFYELIKELKIDRWAVNRLIPISGEKEQWGEKELPLLINKLTKIKKDKFKNKIPTQIHIVNAVPLCAADPIRLNSICSGGRSVDGHERFVIDPRGFAKPIYYLEEDIGNGINIMDCWNSSFMKSLRNYKFLPIECKNCPLLEKCKGGNRYCAYVVNKSYFSPDPLMDYSKIKNFIW